MRLLLDTHALIWALGDDPRLSKSARIAIDDRENEILVSAASAMEVATKFRLGKLPEAEQLARDFPAVLRAADYLSIPITVEHVAAAGALAIPHRDPFDRLLIAQSRLEAAALVSNEKLFDGFGVERFW
ncbi:MAG: type II toxin-antitoxin system VapC family toxin [Proteobacteria bacterium]|nr:type II toxin-antitoxin system VapC family toxin [Pseudomonadota bacterium]